MWGTLCGKGGWLMTVRERTEEIERITLSPFATLSENSRGRAVPEKPCPLRPCFQRDRDRIIHCKAFRRLKQKTQVFLSPEGDHYRTRLTHTLEVSQIARTIARALRLNEDLTEAIALAHDLGHTPFGHAGERALNRLCPGGFKHYEQSARVVTKLEKDGSGLNLTWEVLNGIVTHTRGEWAATREGRVVRFADHIAYMNHDIEDAVTAGVLRNEDIPAEITSVLGSTKSERITSLIMPSWSTGPKISEWMPSGPPLTRRCTTLCTAPCMWTRWRKRKSRKWTSSSVSCTHILRIRPRICRRLSCISCGRRAWTAP